MSRPMRAMFDNGAPAAEPRPISIVAADSHPITLEGMSRLFEREGFDVRARCGDGDECVRALHAYQPEILVLELQLVGRDGLSVLREVKRAGLSTRPVVFTAAHDDGQVLDAMRAGARAVVLKDMDPRLLVECIRKIHGGEPWIDRRSAVPAAKGRDRGAPAQLTRDLTGREIEIVRLVAGGLKNRAVAERLGVTEGTVKVHLHNIYEKVGLRGRLALILFARAKKLA